MPRAETDCVPKQGSDTFFVSSIGALRRTVHATFLTLLASAGFPTATGSHPRIHDLRHSLVVNTLIDWQRDGVDIASRLPVLSTYLGHVNPASTYWYYSEMGSPFRYSWSVEYPE